MAYTPSLGQASHPTDGTITTPGAFPTANISNVGGGAATQQVVRTLYDYNPYAILNRIHERHEHRADLRMLFKAFGFSRGVNAPTTGHYEADWKESLVKIGAEVTASTGAGTSIIHSLHADMMYDTAVTASGSARKASYPRVGQIIILPDGTAVRIDAKNVTTDPHRLTLTPLDSTIDLVGKVVSGESYFIATNAWGEGSSLPEGVLPRIVKYTNAFQIIKEACSATGSELTNQLFVEPVQQQDGSIYLRIKADMMYRFEKQAGGALLWGQTIDNISEFNSELGFDVDVTGTEGLIQFAETNAYEDTYTAGSYGTDDLYAVTRLYEQERVGTSTLFTLDGFDIFVETEQAFTDFFANDYSPALMKSIGEAQGIPSEDMQPFLASDFTFYSGFKAARLSGYNIHFKKLHEFNEAVGAGASAYDYAKWRIFMPFGSTINKRDGSTVPYVGYEYKQLGAYSRENVIGEYGGVGVAGIGGIMDTVSNSYDIHRMGIVCEIAGHFSCPNHIVLQKPA